MTDKKVTKAKKKLIQALREKIITNFYLIQTMFKKIINNMS